MTAAPVVVSAFRNGILCRCPSCGRGPLFDGYLKVAARCSACGLALSHHDSGDGPAVFVVFIVGAVVVGAALVTEMQWSPPIWVHMILWVTLSVVLALALLQPFKGVLIALKFKHDAGQAWRELD